MALLFEGPQFVAKGGSEMLQQRYEKMAAIATQHGIQQHPEGQPTDPGFFLRAIDFISRPLYAVTGIADVLLGSHEQESDKYIVSRVIRELFSGVGGLKGEKEFFGDIAEQAGIGEGGRLSDIIGENILTRRFDPTLRGTAAFALDVFADPLTYVGLGTLGRLSVVSRGGKVTLSATGERLLTTVMDHKTHVMAKRLGRFKLTKSADDVVKPGEIAKRAEDTGETITDIFQSGYKGFQQGDDIATAWEQAIDRVAKTKEGTTKHAEALDHKARVFHQIELEAAERARAVAQAGADAEHRRVLLQEIRNSANRTVGKIISGEMDGETAKKLLKEAGLNPEAADITKELSKLTENTGVQLYIPFRKPKTLFELAESGRVNRAIHYFTDPIQQRVVKILESNKGTEDLLNYARNQKLPLQRAVNNLFNRDEFLAKDVDGYIMHKEDFFNRMQGDLGQLADDLKTNFAGIDNKPELMREIVQYMDNPQGVSIENLVGELSLAHDMSPESLVDFITWAQGRYSLWGATDVKNGVLDPSRYSRFAGRYVNHEILGWDELTDGERVSIANLYSDVTGRNMNVNGATLGRYAEQRHFATLEELEQFLARVNSEIGTNLRVNYDLKSLMAHRGAATVEAAATTRFLDSVRRDFGRKKIMEEAGLLNAILPVLRGPLQRKLAKALKSEDIAVLNEMISRSTTIAADNDAANFFGIAYKEAEKYGLDRGVIKFIDSVMPDTAGRDTVIEFVNVVRTTEDELGNAFQVLGSTRTAVQDDGTVRTVIQLYQDADVTTVAKELVGRRGWNLMSQDDRKTWMEFFESDIKGKWVDPETGRPYQNARDAFAQTAADVALGAEIPPSIVPDKYKPFMKLFENLREVFANFMERATGLRRKMQTGEISEEVQGVLKRAQTANPEGLDISGLGGSYWERFGAETLQRRRLGEGINIHGMSNEPLELASAVNDTGWKNAIQALRGELKYPDEAVKRNVERLKNSRKSRPEDVRQAGDYYIYTDETGDTQWVSTTAAPTNARMRLMTPDGQIVTIGQKTSRDWVEEVVEGSTAEELSAWVRWYRNEAKAFQEYFGEDWEIQFAAAFMANQRMTPRAAFSMSIRQQWNAAARSDMFAAQDEFMEWAKAARDHNEALAKGEARGPKHLTPDTLHAGDNLEKRRYIRPVTASGAALPTQRLRDFFEKGVIEESDSQKLVDFLDSGLFKRTRTLYGDQEFAGDSAVIDVWSYLDAGYVDKERHTWIKNTFGADVAKMVKRDGAITPARYEMAADFLRQTQKYVRNNLDTIKSSDGVLLKDIATDEEWGDLLEFASSFQAMGWMQKRKAAGIGAQFNQPTIGSNIVQMPFEIAVSSTDKSLKALRGKWDKLSDVGKRRATAYLSSRVVEQAMQILGVPIEPRGHLGIGMWAGDVSPNLTLSTPMAPENAEAMMSAIGYLARQDAMFSYMPKLNGDEAGLDLVFKDPIAMQPEKLEGFLATLNEELNRLFALDADKKAVAGLTDAQKDLRAKAIRDLTTQRQREINKRMGQKMLASKKFYTQQRRQQMSYAEALKEYKETRAATLEQVKRAVYRDMPEPNRPLTGATGVAAPVQNGDGSFALRFITDPKFVKNEKGLRPEIVRAINRAADKHNIAGIEINAGNVQSALIEGGKDGQGYIERLESLGRHREVEVLRRARKGIQDEIEQGIDAELKRDSRVRELKQPTIHGQSAEVYFTDSVQGLPTLNPDQGFTISGSTVRPMGGPGMSAYKAKIDEGLIYRPRAGETIDPDVMKQRGYVAFEDTDGQIELLSEVPVEELGGMASMSSDPGDMSKNFFRDVNEIEDSELMLGGVTRDEYVDPYKLAKTLLDKAERHDNRTLKATSVADLVIDMLPKDSALRQALLAYRPHIPLQTEFVIPWQHGMPTTWADEPHGLDRWAARGLHSYAGGQPSKPVTGQKGTRQMVSLLPSHMQGAQIIDKKVVPVDDPFVTMFRMQRHGVNFGTIVHELIHSATVARISFIENAARQKNPMRLMREAFGDAAEEQWKAYGSFVQLGQELRTVARKLENPLLDRYEKGQLSAVEKARLVRVQHALKYTAPDFENAEFELVTYFLTEPALRDALKSVTLGKTHAPDIVLDHVQKITNTTDSDALFDVYMKLSAGMEETAISAPALKLMKMTPFDTRWTTEGFQRRAIDKPMTPQRRRKLAAKEAYESNPLIIKRKELRAAADKEDQKAQALRKQRDDERLKRSGLQEAKEGEQFRKVQAQQIRAFDQAVTARQGKRLDELDRLDQILAEETKAIRAQQPAFQLDLFSTGDIDPAAAEKVTKQQLKALRTKITKAKNRVRAELGEEMADALEAQARLAEYSVELGKKNYMIGRLSQDIGVKRDEITRLHDAAQVPRQKAADMRKEAREIAQGVKRPTVEDIKREDVERLRKLPQEAQAAYLYQGLNNVRTIEHLGNFIEKHRDMFMEIDAKALKQAREMVQAQRTEHPFSPYGRTNRPQQWKKVTVKMANGEDEVWELPEGIADDISGMGQKWLQQPEVRGLLRLFDFGTNTFKGGVTVLFPAFHFRNWYGNVFQSALDITLQAFNPQRHLEALGVMVGGTPLGQKLGIPEVTIKDKFGNQYTSEHLRTLARDHQIAVDFKALQEVIESGPFPEDRKGILAALTSVGDKISKPGRAVGSGIENEARLMHFITLIRRGIAPADAALQVKKFLFDYNNLSSFEKQWMRRIFPFYTWNSKNTRMQIQQLLKKPGLVNNLHKGLLQERGPENDLLPEYLRGDLKVKLEPGPGKVAAFLTGIDLPTQALDVLFSGTLESTMRDNLGLINPLIKSPLEYAMNMDSFSGRSLQGQQYQNKLGPLIDKFPPPMKEWFELKKFPGSDGEMRYTANGAKVYLVFKSWALSRIMGTTAEFTKMIDSDEKVLESWKLMTGMQMREYDFTEAQKNLLRARYERLEDQMIRRGLYMQYTQPYLHPEIKQQQIQATLGSR